MKQRLGYLDGLRGLAALSVVLFHFFSAFVPALIPDQTVTPWPISDTPFGILYNGDFAVIVFFVLSGFVISNSAASKRTTLIASLLVRYVRLALPALSSVLFAWILLSAFPTSAAQLYLKIPHLWLTEVYQRDIPALGSAVSHGMLGIFISGQSSFNNVLWTMKIELLGSSSLYVLYAVLPSRSRAWIFALLAIAVFPLGVEMYAGFALGALLRELFIQKKLPPVSGRICLVAGVCLGGVALGAHHRLHLPRVPRTLLLGSPQGALYPVAAALILYACLVLPSLQRVLSAVPARFLGRISFSLYLFHVPLLYTLFAWLYLSAWPVSWLGVCALLLIFVAVSAGIAYLATVFIDEPVLSLNAKIRATSLAQRDEAPLALCIQDYHPLQSSVAED